MDPQTIRKAKPKRLVNFRFPPWHVSRLEALARAARVTQTSVVLDLIERAPVPATPHALPTAQTLPASGVPEAEQDELL